MSEITPGYIEDYIRSMIPKDKFLNSLEMEADKRGIPIVGATEG